MEKFQGLLKLAQAFSKVAAWKLYIVKWAATNTKLLGMLTTFINKSKNPEFKSKLSTLHNLYSNFVLNMDPEGSGNVNKIPDDISSQVLKLSQEILSDPHVDMRNPQTAFKNDPWLADNLTDLYELLADIGVDIDNNTNDIAEGKDPEPLTDEEKQQILEENAIGEGEEPTDLQKFISEEFGKSEYDESEAPSHIQYLGEGFSGGKKQGPKTESDKILNRIQKSQKAKAIQNAKKKSLENRTDKDNILIAQLERAIAVSKAVYLKMRNDPAKWTEFVELKRKQSLASFHKKKELAEKGDAEAIAKLEHKDKYQANTDKEVKLIRDLLNRHMRDESTSDPIIKAFQEMKKLSVVEKWNQRSLSEPEFKIKQNELKAQEKALVKYLKYKHPTLPAEILEIKRALNPDRKLYNKSI